ncbi:DUF6461 domain-containing protein [Streptomyces sp. NPDC048637]|uniref:DUF6461 domain-containing protein n=1 Tax=Streptomyces sp. NPDC048637 TaxID=3155636 RepID=UPI00343CC46F
MTDTSPLDWIADAYGAHCLVLAKDLTGRELLLRLGAEAADLFIPQDEDEANAFLQEGLENYDGPWGAARAGEADSWAFSLEPASLWGSIRERLERASRATEVICCSEAVGTGTVEYWQDGTLITSFDTLTPQDRSAQGLAADPDRLVAEMRQAGFFDAADPYPRYAPLALLHEVTGVALSQEQTTLALSGRLPVLGLGPEGTPQPSTYEDASGRPADASGGPVGEPSRPQRAGKAKASRGQAYTTP